MAHIGLIYKVHLITIFFISTLGASSYAGICQYCQQASTDTHKNYNCDKCDKIFEKAKKTVEGKNNDYDAKLNMCSPSDQDSLFDSAGAQSAAKVKDDIILIASKPPFEVENMLLKPATNMIGSLFSSLKKPSHTIAPSTQPGIKVHSEYTVSALVSLAISEGGLQDTFAPLANGLDGLINNGDDIEEEPDWSSSLSAAEENVDSEIGTLFWLLSENGWIFLEIPPSGNLILFLWDYCSSNGEPSHYSLIEFDNMDSVRGYLSSLIKENQCINSGCIRNVLKK